MLISRLPSSLKNAVRRVAVICVSAGAVLGAMAPKSTQTAVANGDTRTLYLTHAHTGETITATFRVNGSYDSAVLDRLNHFLRDWRNDAVIKMDPRLFDVVWETHRGAGSTSPIRINSAYRSPETNSMLRRRSRGVAEFSLHTRGMAMDIHVPDVNTDRLRETAIRMQRGGVGFYPSSGFVHLDVGNVRAWPRMRYDQLARIFPDGRSIHIAADGRTLPGYEDARVALAARNGSYAPTLAQVKSKGFFATLFGWEDPDDTPPPAANPRARRAPAPTQVAAFAPEEPRSPVLARAEANRPRGETFIGPASVVATPQESARAALLASAPLPPRRPVEAAVASLAPVAPTLGPIPPARPAEFNVASVAPIAAPIAGPVPPVRPARAGATDVASLFGASGRVAATPGLPPVITEGSEPIAAGVLAYAPQPAPVRMIRQARTAPVAAQPVGLRAARNQVAPALTPARLDRSNFIAMTAPVSLETAASGSTLGSSLAPLRPAARREARDLMFGAPQGDLVVTELRPRP